MEENRNLEKTENIENIKEMNVYEKLINIQKELKAPKSNYNDFGKYNYRSCEDILEAVKPICLKYRAVLILSDNIINVGTSNYVEATAILVNIDSPIETISNKAEARESIDKKGMDDSQITGTASSYARKYALNGLFNIDDTKDADTNEYHNQITGNKKTNKNKDDLYITEEQKAKFKDLGITEESAIAYCKVKNIDEILKVTAEAMIKAKQKKINK